MIYQVKTLKKPMKNFETKKKINKKATFICLA